MAGSSLRSRWLTTSRTLSGLDSWSIDRTVWSRPPAVSTAPDSTSIRHSSETRNGLPWVRSPTAAATRDQLVVALAARGPQHEIGRVPRIQPGDPQARDGVRAPQVGQQVAQRRAVRGVRLAVGGHQQQACVAGRADEVADQRERRLVGPVEVLQHEQHADGGDWCWSAGRRRRRAAGGAPCPRPRAPARAARRRPIPGRGRDGRARRPPGRRPLSARPAASPGRAAPAPRPPAGRATRRRCRSRRRAPGRRRPCLVGQLADEPALAAARLSAQQGDAAPLAVGPRQQRAKGGELARPPDERERGLQPELAGESADGHPSHCATGD